MQIDHMHCVKKQLPVTWHEAKAVDKAVAPLSLTALSVKSTTWLESRYFWFKMISCT